MLENTASSTRVAERIFKETWQLSYSSASTTANSGHFEQFNVVAGISPIRASLLLYCRIFWKCLKYVRSKNVEN